MKIVVVGDFCEKLRVHDSIVNHRHDEMFGELLVPLSEADYRIVNFEFPIVQKEGCPIRKNGPCLSGSIDSISALKYVNFNVATLANNHILDQGAQCCLDTKSLLEEEGIQTVGAGENIEKAANILYLNTDNGETLGIINCCEHEFSVASEFSAGANPINPVSQYNAIQEAKQKATYVLVITHSGHEHFNLPSTRMQELYRFYIEVGADAVINHHQHCYSGYEIYQNKPIFYGLGNFLFDHKSLRNSFWNEGFMVKLDLNASKLNFEIIPYKQCNESPSVKLLDEQEKKVFFDRIGSLNEIICDKASLRKQVEAYYLDSSKYELNILEMYTGRVCAKLLSHNLLPRFVRSGKLLQILNHVECESHRDKLIYALKNKR